MKKKLSVLLLVICFLWANFLYGFMLFGRAKDEFKAYFASYGIMSLTNPIAVTSIIFAILVWIIVPTFLCYIWYYILKKVLKIDIKKRILLVMAILELTVVLAVQLLCTLIAEFTGYIPWYFMLPIMIARDILVAVCDYSIAKEECEFSIKDKSVICKIAIVIWFAVGTAIQFAIMYI